MEQRIAFVVRALEQRDNFSELCREFGISRPTGYRWVNRYREVGNFVELREKSRRPHHSPGRTAPEIEEEVERFRKRYSWGARKLRDRLWIEKGIDLPEITIHRILKRRGMIAPEESHPAATHRFERKAPNELWQMDFKGEYPLLSGHCYPLSILDDHSRFLVGLHGLPNQRGESVYGCLIETFERYGVPESLLMDHGTPWWSSSNAQGLTWVSVRLIQQGIRISLSGIKHPQTQGKVERFHRTLKAAMKHRGLPETLLQWKVALTEFRNEYNAIRPHEALDMSVPASRYQPSVRAYNPNPPEWEYPEGALVKPLNSQGCLDFNHHRYFVCEALAGERVRIEQATPYLLVSYRHMYIRQIHRESGRTEAFVTPRSSE
ncbi:MAG TPA: IS481 family transposase [bacterium]|nr:IS481 family transposase [bacterium]